MYICGVKMFAVQGAVYNKGAPSMLVSTIIFIVLR